LATRSLHVAHIDSNTLTAHRYPICTIMTTTGDTSSQSLNDSSVMKDVVTPHLYRRNAFRVLGLLTNVTATDLLKHQKRLQVMEKLGTGGGGGPTGVLPLSPPPDVDALRRAGQRIQDPETRLMDELFWFWAVDAASPSDDSGIVHLRNGEIAAAEALWKKHTKLKPHAAAAAHNIAVLNHALALDAELDASNGGVAAQNGVLDARWTAALTHWAACWDSDHLWAHLTTRVRELDDPRLTTGLVRRIRASLPSAMVRMLVKMAVAAAQAERTEEALRYLSYLRSTGLSHALQHNLFDAELSALTDFIVETCSSVAATAKADPRKAHEVATTLLDNVTPQLAVLQAAVDSEHHFHQVAGDAVASAVLSAVRVYGREQGSWLDCLDLLGKALSFAESAQLRSVIEGDLRTVSDLNSATAIYSACNAALDSASKAPERADAAANKLLQDAPGLMEQMRAKGASAGGVDEAKDAVALAVIGCAVKFGNKVERWSVCVDLLRRAQPWATTAETQSRLNTDLDTVTENAKFGDLEPLTSAPSLHTINGIGTTLYGATDFDAGTGSHMSTLYFVFLAIPLFPLARYRVIQKGNSYRFLGMGPLRQGDKIHIAVTLAIILIFILVVALSQ
jgi:hypothetical protein